MLSNNNQRLHIILSMVNHYDYHEFVDRCRKENVEIMSFSQYAQKVEALMAAMAKYPDIAPDEAYLKHIEDNKGFLQPPPALAANNPATGCGGCGGGRVR